MLTGASVAMLAGLSAESASAQSWTGATSNDWTVSSNWTSPKAVPTGGAVEIVSGSTAVLGVNGAASGATSTLFLSGTSPNLIIENGSTLTSTGTAFIEFSTGSATATVTGAGSQWIISGQLDIGDRGTGTLNIEDGAVVTAQNASGTEIGVAAGSSGTLNVSGGGTLATTKLFSGVGPAQANFDDATLRALASSPTFISGLTVSQLNIAAGGLTVDTNGFSIGAPGFSGVGGLTTAGTGTLTLNGVSTYAGSTVIGSGSTLALTGGGSIAASSRVVDNGIFDLSPLITASSSIQSLAGSGTVNMGTQLLTLTNANDTFAGTFIGGSGLTLTGGTETLTGNNSSFAGPTTVQGGTLAVNGSLGGTMNVLSGGQLQGTGTVGATTNAGVVAPGNGTGIGSLTIAGDYTGSGGTVQIGSVLGGDASATDRLVVTGNTSGSSNVRVVNLGGMGAQTINGIQIINVAGASNGTFSLLGNYTIQGQQAIVAGAYAYTLQKNGVTTPADGDWYLRSSLIAPPPSAPAGPLYQAGVPVYENYAQVLLGMNALPTLQERVGDRYWGGNGAGVQSANNAQSPIWARVEGQHSDMQPQNTTGSTYSADQVKVQMGIDGLAMENNAGKLIVGMTAQYGTVAANVSSFYGNGQIRADGYSVGSTLTWYGDNGVYVDGQAQATKYSTDLSSALVGALTTGQNDGFGYAFSVEGGKRIGLGNGWSITPQAQLTYSKVDFSSFSDRFASLVSLDNADSLLGRAGVAVNYQRTWRDADGQMTSSDIYGIANLDYEFLNGTTVDVSGTSFANANDRLWGSVGIGGSYGWHSGKYSLYGELSYNTSLSNIGVSDSYKGIGGFRIVW